MAARFPLSLTLSPAGRGDMTVRPASVVVPSSFRGRAREGGRARETAA